MNIDNSNQISNEWPEPPQLQHFTPPVDIGNPETYFDGLEREFWLSMNSNPDAVKAAVERAAARWACISSKSHREEKIPVTYAMLAYDMKAEVKPIYHGVQGSKPPSREGEVIHRFSKKSRARLFDKFRRMRKDDLELPYFVTLTYRENFQDCTAAKKHLDTFFKRWRRQCSPDGEFRYAWKMEFQTENYETTGRCAIHFHLAMWLPEKTINRLTVKSKKPNVRLKPLRQLIGRQWAEITADVDGVPDVPFTRIQYYQKKDGSYSVYDRGQRTYNAPDVWHELYGTNVRESENLKQATGYMAKYLGETVPDSVIEQVGETGRFWGFSRNFDFSAIHCYATDITELDTIHEIGNRLNDKFWKQYKEYQKGNIKRVKKQYADNPKKRDTKLEIIARKTEQQARRHVVNKLKIKLGYAVAFELLAEDANDIFRDCLKTPIPATDYFQMRRQILEFGLSA